MTLNIPLENQWANINQTWHKASLGKGIQIYLNEGTIPFPKGDNNDSGTIGLVSPKFVATKDQVYIQMKDHALFQEILAT